MEKMLTVSQAEQVLGLSHAKLLSALWHGNLKGRKNHRGDYVWILADSVDRYLALHNPTMPSGYIPLSAVMEMTGWTDRPIRKRLCEGTWRGIRRVITNNGSLTWIGVLEADVKRDVRLRCKRCEILLEPDEPGPLCKWCESGMTDFAKRKEPRQMQAVPIKGRRVFPVEKRLDNLAG